MKNCIICGVDLTSETTTWYRQKNYIHKCNVCNRAEKAQQAREKRKIDPSAGMQRYLRHRDKLKREDPIKYSCTQMRASAKKRADALSIGMNITTDYLISIATEECGILKYKLKYGGGEKTKESASLDRIDPVKGYVVGNVQIISNLANMMKNAADHTDLMNFANWVMRSHDKAKGVQTDKIKP